MEALTLKLVMGGALFAWLFVCAFIYRAFRGALWLASPTAASCLFLLGATAAASVFVPRAFFLAPLWAGVVVLVALHLWKASGARRGVRGSTPGKIEAGAGLAPTRAGVKEQSYI
jgi:hypothetical protein